MNLRTYLDQLPRGEISKFAKKLEISPTYLSQLAAVQDGRRPSPPLCNRIVALTRGAVTRQELRPDDWRSYWPTSARARRINVEPVLVNA